MQKYLPLMLLLCSTGCGQSPENNPVTIKPAHKGVTAVEDSMALPALTFINGYVANVNKMDQSVDAVRWSDSSALVTEHFRVALKKLLADAYKADSELGLDADPILNAQDVPDNGFKLASVEKETNYLVVAGKAEPAFTVTMKMVRANGRWLVDGCGMVNIPEDRMVRK